MSKIKLKTEGMLISGFDSAAICENVYTIDNAAVFEFTDKTVEDLKKVKNIIQKGKNAEVFVDDTLRLKGYVSKVHPFYRVSASEVTPCLQIQVNTPAAAYVNNSLGFGQTFKSQSVSAIIAALCPDLELEVCTDRILPKFVVYGYEDYDEAISRLCVKSNLLVYSGSHGQLIIAGQTSGKDKVGSFRTGENVISIENLTEETNGITVSGQLPLDDTISVKAALCSSLKEPGTKIRYVYGDDISEAALSAAKSKNKRVAVTTPHWFDNQNRLLELNTQADVVDSWLDLNDTMLISALVLKEDKNGLTSHIELEN